jgi:HSF-type DNA-binding
MSAAGDGTSPGKKNKVNVPPFLSKTWTIMHDQESQPFIHWTSDADGCDTFEIKEQRSIEERVLPRYFKHGNMCSFVRQLNTYGFSKVQDPHATTPTDEEGSGLSNSALFAAAHESQPTEDNKYTGLEPPPGPCSFLDLFLVLTSSSFTLGLFFLVPPPFPLWGFSLWIPSPLPRQAGSSATPRARSGRATRRT